MIVDRYKGTLRQFKSYYPTLYSRAVDWWGSGRMSIVVKLDDGDMYDYDPIDNSIRRVCCIENGEDIDETAIRKAFGYNLQKMIPFSGLSKGELAEKAGITNAMLSRYIRGNSIPSALTARRIAMALRCTVDELFDDVSIR